MITLFQIFGKTVISFLKETGKVVLLFIEILKNMIYVIKDKDLFFAQAYDIGVKSLILVMGIAFFTGAVVSYQSAEHMQKLMPLTFLGVSTYKMMALELGPVLTGVIMAGRYGASVAAELGTMKVTEQIDALKSMAIDPVRYLCTPRFTAAIIMLPLTVVFANIVGIFSGFFISSVFYDVNFHEYFNGIQTFFRIKDISMGLVKTFTFGGIISLIGSYVGFHATGGAEGVGKATVRAFVVSSVLILLADLLVAMIML